MSGVPLTPTAACNVLRASFEAGAFGRQSMSVNLTTNVRKRKRNALLTEAL